MITNVKMQVTPDLSERIQEICFQNNIYWSNGSRKISCINEPYLFIGEDNTLFSCNEKYEFDVCNYKKISAYDFIASQGEQKWLPKYGEEVWFSDDGKNWYIEKFNYYIPNRTHPFITKQNIHMKYCRPLQKQIHFVQFLKDNDAYEQYMHNVKIENQRWVNINEYIKLEQLKKKLPCRWIECAFNWRLQKEGYNFWQELNEKWHCFIENMNNIVWE